MSHSSTSEDTFSVYSLRVGKKSDKSEKTAHIALRGCRQHNLQGIDLDIPLGKLTVVTGPSGSGKSSLAFHTLYAEGQRRYVETFSPYVRQFFDRMDKPDVDSITGIPPAIAIEQKNHVRTTRSTVGTLTEINDYLKLLFARLAVGYDPVTGDEIRPDSSDSAAAWQFSHGTGGVPWALRVQRAWCVERLQSSMGAGDGTRGCRNRQGTGIPLIVRNPFFPPTSDGDSVYCKCPA